MFIDVKKYLSHKVPYYFTATDLNGITQITSATTLSCFAFYGEFKRTHETPRETKSQGWQVLFGTDARTLISVGGIIGSVVDADNFTVISSGTIKKIEPYRHWSHGLQCFVAEVDTAG